MKHRNINLVVLLLLGCLAISRTTATDAEPQHVWVHYDYMVFPPGSVYPGGIVYPNGVSMEPSKAAIDMVVAAFARQGLTLHIDPVHNAIPGHQVIIPDFYPAWRNLSTACAGGPGYVGLVGPDAVSFLVLKQQYFHPHGDHPWHYAIFGYSAAVSFLIAYDDGCPIDPLCGVPPDPTSVGISELPGFNFILALGTFSENYGITNVGDITTAGIFMHELGHNFGLEHGGVYGGEGCLAYKPNYISVMNYFYNVFGIPYAAAPGSSTPIGWRVDYSSFTALTLNEADLDEFAGVGGPPGDTDIVNYCASGRAGCSLYGPSVGPIDWNNDGVIEPHAHGDIDGDDGYSDYTLRGFDDWAYVKQQLQRPPDEIDHLPKRAVP
jgi:hypothetical protein